MTSCPKHGQILEKIVQRLRNIHWPALLYRAITLLFSLLRRIYYSLHPQALCVGGDGVIFGGGDAGLVLLRGTRLPVCGDTPQDETTKLEKFVSRVG